MTEPMSAEEFAEFLITTYQIESKWVNTHLCKSFAEVIKQRDAQRDAALSATQGVPEGFVLAPCHADDAMNRAGNAAHKDYESNWSPDGNTSMQAAWKAMLAVAPKAPTAAPDAFHPIVECPNCQKKMFLTAAPKVNQSGDAFQVNITSGPATSVRKANQLTGENNGNQTQSRRPITQRRDLSLPPR